MKTPRGFAEWFTAQDRAELVATVVLAIAAIATAWSGFQSAKWSGEQAIAFSEAGAARTESARASATAGQLTQIDVGLFVDWVAAVDADNRAGVIEIRPGVVYEPDPDTLSGFLFLRFRDEFEPAVQAWLAEGPLVNPDAPSSPFAMPDYVLESSLRADEFLLLAEQRSAAARQFNQNSDNYILSSVIFALVLFFAGVSTKLKRERNRALMLSMALVGLLGALTVLTILPIHALR
jgi:hypothetical protein